MVLQYQLHKNTTSSTGTTLPDEWAEGGVSYRFPKIFQAMLNKNEWNIYKYSGKH